MFKLRLYVLLIVCCSVFTGTGFAQTEDTTRVLFIGNSFTYYNNMPQLFEQLGNLGNHPVKIMQHTPGGVSVGDISQGSLAHMNNATVYQYIRDYKWDFLVLQDNQGRFVLDYGVFPSSSLVVKGHKMIRDSLLHYSPCAQVLWFAGWGPKNGYLPYSATGVGLIDRIYRNYTVLLDSAGHTITPIGAAWKRVVSASNPPNLWDVDDTHPSYAGSLLTAHVIYSSIFKTSAIESAFTTTAIPFSTDTMFRRVAYQTVLDSAQSTHYNLITPTLVCSNGNCAIVNAVNAKWYNNGQLVGTGLNYSAVSNMQVQAMITYSNGCTLRSAKYTISASSVTGIAEEHVQAVAIAPNPFNE